MANVDFYETFFNGWGPSKFEETVEKVKASGDKWTDPDFPPNETSLYNNPARKPHWPEVTEWKRATELSPEPKMFLDGTDPGDVIQGVLGDCWFLGALSVVAARDDLIMRIVATKEINDYGVYEFRFFKNGNWRSVLIDDWIPTHGGKPIFSRCKNLAECWVMLIEKAYAKLHKTYENLEGGDETFAFADLTAAVPETFDLESKELKKSVADASLFKMVDDQQNQGHFTGCAKLVSGGQAEANTGQGILQNHAYGIIDIKETSTGVKLFRVRNPWGQGEWKGRWSDNSEEWTEDLLKELEYQFAEDGTFWIEFSDFVQQYNRLYVNRIFEKKNEWVPSECRGEWVGNSAGGCGNFPSWPNNPQYGLHLKQNADVLIVLSQRDVRQEGYGRDPLALGFLVLKSEDSTKKVAQLRQPDFVGMTQFHPKRDVSKVFYNLPAGHYVISPTTFQPKKETQFILQIYVKGDDATLYDIQKATSAKVEDLPLITLSDNDSSPELKAFKKYDKDGSGFISAAELKNLAYDLGAHLSDDELAVALADISKNSSGQLSFESFLQWWTGANKLDTLFLDDVQKLAIKKAAAYFREFDIDGSGTLSPSEFGKLHKKLLGADLSEVQLSKWIKTLDKDNSGAIDFNEYVGWLLKSGGIPARSSLGTQKTVKAK